MKKKLISFILKIVAVIFIHRKYDKYGSRANLGCGLHCLPGWVNIDGSLYALLGSRKFDSWNKLLYKLSGVCAYYSFEHFNKVIRTNKLYYYDLSRKIPFKNNSLQVIYSSHFLEHLSKETGQFFLNECFRVLKKNGILRLALPDLDKAIAMYQKGQAIKMLDLFFYTSTDYDFAYHKYNYPMLATALKKIGFSKITKTKYKHGLCPDIVFLDVYPEHSFYIECIKK